MFTRDSRGNGKESKLKENELSHHNLEEILSCCTLVDEAVCYYMGAQVNECQVSQSFQQNFLKLCLEKITFHYHRYLKCLRLQQQLYFVLLYTLGSVLFCRCNEHFSVEFKLAHNFQRGLIRNSYVGKVRQKPNDLPWFSANHSPEFVL